MGSRRALRGGGSSLRRSKQKDLPREEATNRKTDNSTKRTQRVIRSTSGLGVFSQEIE